MAKAVLITYNKLPDVNLGRQIIGDVIVYSADYGRDSFLRKTTDKDWPAFLKNWKMRDEEQNRQRAEAVKEISSLIKSIKLDDLNEADTIILYVGIYAMAEVIDFVKIINGLGKRILLIACDCSKEQKQLVATKLGVEIIFTEECGGRKTCKSFIDGWNDGGHSK